MKKIYELSILTEAEQKDLTRLEEIIAQGILCFVEVGRALMTIRDKRLYRQTHRTFQSYCLEKWEFGRSYAYRLIASAEVADNLSPIAPNSSDSPILSPNCQQITSESQLRPLTKLEPEQQREAWQKAVETAPAGKVTARHLSSVVDELEATSDEAVEATEPEESVQVEPDGVVQSDTVKNLCRIFKAASEEDQLQFLQWTEINYKELWNEAFWAD
jgi:hypothetical protein